MLSLRWRVICPSSGGAQPFNAQPLGEITGEEDTWCDVGAISCGLCACANTSAEASQTAVFALFMTSHASLRIHAWRRTAIIDEHTDRHVPKPYPLAYVLGHLQSTGRSRGAHRINYHPSIFRQVVFRNMLWLRQSCLPHSCTISPLRSACGQRA